MKLSYNFFQKKFGQKSLITTNGIKNIQSFFILIVILWTKHENYWEKGYVVQLWTESMK